MHGLHNCMLLAVWVLRPFSAAAVPRLLLLPVNFSLLSCLSSSPDVKTNSVLQSDCHVTDPSGVQGPSDFSVS